MVLTVKGIVIITILKVYATFTGSKGLSS